MAGLGDILQQAEQLTADMDSGTDLPRIDRNLHQLAEAGQRLWTRIASTAAPDTANVRASILLGTRGFDVPKLSQKLDSLSTAKTFEPLEPVRDTDIQGFLKNERENAILAAIEEARKNTFSQAEKHHWHCMESEWEREKQRILNSLLGAGQEPVEFPTEIESMSVSSLNMTGRSVLDSTEIAYARQVFVHNEAVIQARGHSLIDSFVQTSKKFDNQGIKDCWSILTEMTDQQYHNTHSPETIRFSQESQQFFINQARSYLESSYLKYIEKTVYDNPQEARLGGVPDRINLIKSFLRIKLPPNAPELEDGDLDGIPIWPIVFYCLRCGELESALQAVYKAQQNIGDFREYVKEYVHSGERRLSPSTEAKLRLHYRRSVKASPDPFKRAVCCLVGCCDTEDNHPEVINKTEDYLWLKLNQVSFDGQEDIDDQDRTTLQQLQIKLLEDYGESHFNAYQKPILYFKVLLLTAQFEAAVEFLFRMERYRSHAVHFALALYNQQLILQPDSVQSQLLSKDPHDPPPTHRLNVARLVKLYTRKFEMTDPREALQYFFLLKGIKGPQGEDIFTSCVSELVLETREFDMLLGKVEEDGTRKAGCIEKFHGDTQRIVEVVAKDTENKGLFEEAVKLYDLAKNHEKCLEVMNKLLSQVVSQPNSPQSSRERLNNMAIAMANRFKSQGHTATRSRCSTFYLLLDLIQFFDLYHQNRHSDSALEVMQQLKLVPLGGESVEQKVAAFRQYTDEIRRNLPDVLLATMNILYTKYKQGSTGGFSPLGASRRDDGGQEKFRSNMRRQARALITFAGLIPYRMPGDTNARLVQMEVLMN